MAKATIGQVSRTVETVITEDVVRLELSKEEAQFILDYLGHTVVGYGLRKHSDDVCEALIKAGVKYSDDFFLHIAGDIKYNSFKYDSFKGIEGGC